MFYLQAPCRSIRRGWRSSTSSTKRDSEMQVRWATFRNRPHCVDSDASAPTVPGGEYYISGGLPNLVRFVWRGQNIGWCCRTTLWTWELGGNQPKIRSRREGVFLCLHTGYILVLKHILVAMFICPPDFSFFLCFLCVKIQRAPFFWWSKCC